MTVWFTVELEDTPGSLARVATALAERGVNIKAIVGIAEDTDGALMLETSDADATRAAGEEERSNRSDQTPKVEWAGRGGSKAADRSGDVHHGLQKREGDR